MIKLFCYVFYTELLLRLRQPTEWLYPLTFFVLVISLFPFALTPDAVFLQQHLSGIIWIAALLSIFLLSITFFVSDVVDGHLEQWILQAERAYFMLLAKLAAHVCCASLPLLIITPIIGFVFHLDNSQLSALIFSLLLGLPILVLLGCFCSALTLGLSHAGLLLSLLMLPLAMPVLILCVLTSEHAAPLLMLLGILLLTTTFLPMAMLVLLKLALEH